MADSEVVGQTAVTQSASIGQPSAPALPKIATTHIHLVIDNLMPSRMRGCRWINEAGLSMGSTPGSLLQDRREKS
jgi:hypothetical protein